MMVKVMSGKKLQPAGKAGLAELEAVLCEVLDAAAAVTVPLFRRSLAVHDKGKGAGFDPVTPADRWAERAMRELLTRRVPAHRIEGEEHGSSGRDDPHALRWILDPIDGTKSYVAGIPLWGTLVGLWQGDEPLIGGIDHPILGERFIGGVNGARRICAGEVAALKVRPCARLGDAVLCATEPESAAPLARHVRFSRYSSDCYAYALLASGLVDAVVDTDLALHDIAAIVPVVQAAGGIITDWTGGHDFASGRIAAAGDRRVHAEMLPWLSAAQAASSS
jgi:myo-inositol-1(or 4)-monophosphatase